MDDDFNIAEHFKDFNDVLFDLTPPSWASRVTKNLELLLIDHAHCERKAAQTAMTLIYRFPAHPFVPSLSKLVREEMVHFEQVIKHMGRRDIFYRSLKPSEYGAFMGKMINKDPKHLLIDTLIVAAIIEARSCERMEIISRFLDGDLKRFYQRLHDAEKRHCIQYLNFAQQCSSDPIKPKLFAFAKQESNWLNQKSNLVRFHSPHGSD